MNERSSTRAGQLCAMVFLSLAVDMAVRPFTARGSAPAQMSIPAAVLNTALVCLLLLPLLAMSRRGLSGELQGLSAAARIFLALSAALFALAGAGAAVRTERFFRYVSDEPLPRLLFFAVLLLSVFYALQCGLDSLLRVIGITAVLFAASVALMLLSNAGSMHLFRLGTSPFEPLAVLDTAARGFTLPPELLLLFLLCTNEGKGSPPLIKTLAALAVFYIVLTFCTQAVLGPQAQQQTQTIHTFSRLGSISVFRRLDALHIAAWVLAELCKIAALASGVSTVLSPLLGQERRKYAVRCTVCLLAAAIAVCMELPQDALNIALTVGTAFLLAYWMLYVSRKGRVYAKKNGKKSA